MMILYLIKEDRFYSMILPNKVKGQYWLRDLNNKGDERKLLSIEAVGNEWILKSNKRAMVIDKNGAVVKNTVVHPMSFLNIRIVDEKDKKVTLFAEPISRERGTYNKFLLRQACSLRIGRGESNDIVYDNEFVSGDHAELQYNGENWSLLDKNSTNGTYVNQVRVMSINLAPGDCIFVMGLKIVVGKQFFAINNPDGCVRLNTTALQKYQQQEIDENKTYDDETAEEFFFRSPRLKKDIVPVQISIDPPPSPQKEDETPLTLVIGPSLTMGLASMSMGIFTLMNVLSNGGSMMQAMPTLIMSFSMLLGTILWPILTKRYDKGRKRKHEVKRQSKYLEYLEEVKDKIRTVMTQQKEILEESVITLEECAARIQNKQTDLWERSSEQSDFLKLRLGRGNLPAELVVNYQPKKFTLEDDNLQNAMLSIAAEDKMLKDVPVAISLMENFNMGIIGSYQERMNLLKSFILQAIALHSYDELKICLICDEEMTKEMSFVKYLPHLWNDERTQRYLASTPEEVRELSALWEKSILPRMSDQESSDRKFGPCYLIVAASMKLADLCESYRKILGAENHMAVSVLSLGNELKDLPKEVKTVIDLKADNTGVVYDKDDVSGKRLPFTKEKVNEDILPLLSEELANIQLDLKSQKFALPEMMTFLEMFEAGKIEHLNTLTRWKENNPTKSLQTPIGVGTTGELFMLDLHEKFHGPHGLVAGMTGSGKSEFIITYILSLAVNYHPDEVAFVLIDYKGGGLAGAFEDEEKGIKLPHLAGTITNLDGTAVTRSLISIQSELRRRQAIFNEARRTANEGTMDIYKYQQLYREGVVEEPIPHLFIISDEFAELKQQQPEFMQQLISAARIGRSLGVHLILATQKPSGVVDDQIWSNSKFRICLKVQDRSDSQEMIKRPDAAELSQTGRFYLQVGFNELFALGQSAWCGAEYKPTDTIEKSTDNSIEVVDNLGRTMVKMKPAVRKDESTASIKQVVGIVQYLSELAREENICVRPLWLPTIPEYIFLEDLEKKYSFQKDKFVLSPIVGEYDDPYNQSQRALQLPLSEEGNCLIYGTAGSGKSVMLTTLLYALIKNYSSSEVNIYIMDFGAETLRAFEQAPHVGGVVLVSEEEKTRNLLKLLRNKLTERKRQFADIGGDYRSYRKQTGEQVPHIVVILNNYSAFREQYEEYEAEVQTLTQDGMKVGMYFVVTAASTNAMRYSMTQNFRLTMTMQLNDETEYAMVVGRTNGLYPSNYIGRGLVKYDMPYEFQTAHTVDMEDELSYIRQYCGALASNDEVAAAQIPVLPKLVNAEHMMKTPYTLSDIPVGISKKELEVCTADLQTSFIYPVVAQDTDATGEFIDEFILLLKHLNVMCEVWDEKANIETCVVRCFDEMVRRNNEYKDAGKDSAVLEEYEQRVFILRGVKSIFNSLSVDGKDKLHVLLENGQAIYNMHFVMADAAASFEEFNAQEWYRRHMKQPEGVWIGDGVADQYTLKINRMSNEYYAEIGNLYGYRISKGKAVLIKSLSSTEEE